MTILLSFSAGQLSLDTSLDLITYLKSETHNVPLIQGLGYLETFYKMIEKRSLSDVTQNVKVSPDTKQTNKINTHKKERN